MIRKIVITISDDARKTQESKFLLGLLKLVEKEEIKFYEDSLLGRDITKNNEIRETIMNIIKKYEDKVPMTFEFKHGKVNQEGKIILTWEYENKNKS